MSNKFNSDSLESFFQKGLQDDLLADLASDGWDMPSESVWDNVETGIAVRQIRGKKWGDNKPWLSVAAAVLFITVFYQTLWQQQHMDGLQNQLGAQTTLIEQIDDHQNTSQSAAFQNSIASIPLAESTSDQLVSTANQKNTSKKINNTSLIPTEITTNTLFDESHYQSIVATSKIGAAAITDQTNPTTYQPTEWVKQSIAPFHVNSKEMKALDDVAIRLNSDSEYKEVEPLKARVDKKRIYAGTYMSALTNTIINETGNADLKDLVDNQRFASSTYQAGIKIGYQLSDKWSVETGIAYNKVKQQSEHQLGFAFDSDAVNLNSNGAYEGTYTADLTTSYGQMPVDVLLSHGAVPSLAEGQAMPLNLKSEQTLEMIQIPVAARYKIGNGRLKLHLTAGATANILTNKDMKVIAPTAAYALPDLAEVKHQNTTLKGGRYLDDINNLSLSLTAGLEFDLALTDQLHLYVAPTYSKGVTPVYENDDEVEEESAQATNLSHVAALVGVNYYF